MSKAAKESKSVAQPFRQPRMLLKKDALTAVGGIRRLAELVQHSSDQGPWGPIISEGVRGSQTDFKVEGQYAYLIQHPLQTRG